MVPLDGVGEEEFSMESGGDGSCNFFDGDCGIKGAADVDGSVRYETKGAAYASFVAVIAPDIFDGYGDVGGDW